MTIKECENKIIKVLEKKHISNREKITKEIIAYITKQPVAYLEKNGKGILRQSNLKKLETVIQNLEKDMPVAYIVRKHQFMGMHFTVNRHVFISSPETEILVQEVIQILNENKKIQTVLELCTGSGAIAISIAKNVKYVNILATDISNQALAVANQNLSLLGHDENVKFLQSNLFEKITEKVDLIVANPPYGKSKEIRKREENLWKLYEPLLARDGGINGLKYLKKILLKAHTYLHPGGYLCLEIGVNQKEAVMDLLKKISIYQNIRFIKDKEGNERVLICQTRI